MKKIVLGIMVGLFIALIGVKVSLAKDITFSDITAKFMENYNPETDTVKMTSDANSITYTYKDEDTEFSSTFKHDNGIITYEYQEDNPENDFAHSLIDALFIQRLIEIILELREININTLDLSLTNVTFEENGIEFKNNSVNVSGSTSDSNNENDFDIDLNVDADISIESVSSLKIDINKLNLPLKNSSDTMVEEDTTNTQNTVTDNNSSDVNTSNNNNTNSNVNNSEDEKLPTSPQTGATDILAFVISGSILGIFYKCFINKKNKIVKI